MYRCRLDDGLVALVQQTNLELFGWSVGYGIQHFERFAYFEHSAYVAYFEHSAYAAYFEHYFECSVHSECFGHFAGFERSAWSGHFEHLENLKPAEH